MKDGTIILFEDKNSKNWLIQLQYKITKSWIYHVALYFEGQIWECGIFSRNDKIENGVTNDRNVNEIIGCKIQEPLKEFNCYEHSLMYSFLIKNRNKKYFWFKFIMMAIIYPCRPIFDKLKWYPFKNWFYVCSEYVDKSYKAKNQDLFPERDEDFTIPNDYDYILLGFQKRICTENDV